MSKNKYLPYLLVILLLTCLGAGTSHLFSTRVQQAIANSYNSAGKVVSWDFADGSSLATGFSDIEVIFASSTAVLADQQADIVVSYACTIVKAYIRSTDGIGTATVDVWIDTTYPPTDADSVTASAPLDMQGDDEYNDTTLTGWTTAIAADSTIRFNTDVTDTTKQFTVGLKIKK